MKLPRLLTSVIVMLAILASLASAVRAEEGNPPQGDKILKVIMSKGRTGLSNADIAQVVDLALANQVSVGNRRP